MRGGEAMEEMRNRGEQSKEREGEEEERGERGVRVSCMDPPFFLFFGFNSSLLTPHDYSLLIIPRVPEPLILNRSPKYNRGSTYLPPNIFRIDLVNYRIITRFNNLSVFGN